MDDLELLKDFIDWYRQRVLESDGDAIAEDAFDIVQEYLQEK